MTAVLPPHAQRLVHFMAQANARYYASTPLLSDFITAPETRQVSGALLGGWAAIGRHGTGCPASLTLAEAGPGRGTAQADAPRLATPPWPPMGP